MNTFLNNVLGTTDLGHFTAAFFFAITGVGISLLIHSTNRDKDSGRTPFKFNPWFLIRDNSTRIILNMLLILVTLRFFPEVTGKELSMMGALTTGLSFDKLGELLRNYCVIDKK
jgi:hypothetical protein